MNYKKIFIIVCLIILCLTCCITGSTTSTSLSDSSPTYVVREPDLDDYLEQSWSFSEREHGDLSLSFSNGTYLSSSRGEFRTTQCTNASNPAYSTFLRASSDVADGYTTMHLRNTTFEEVPITQDTHIIFSLSMRLADPNTQAGTLIVADGGNYPTPIFCDGKTIKCFGYTAYTLTSEDYCPNPVADEGWIDIDVHYSREVMEVFKNGDLVHTQYRDCLPSVSTITSYSPYYFITGTTSPALVELCQAKLLSYIPSPKEPLVYSHRYSNGDTEVACVTYLTPSSSTYSLGVKVVSGVMTEQELSEPVQVSTYTLMALRRRYWTLSSGDTKSFYLRDFNTLIPVVE